VKEPPLRALSQEHDQMLAEAERLRRGAEAPNDDDVEAAASAFVDFFQTVTLPHLREEEETLFPLAVEREECRPLLARALLEHLRLRRLAARLREREPDRQAMTDLAALLEGHVRLEEHELFPLLQAVRSSSKRAFAGPVWGQASEDLNATLLEWPAGDGPGAQVNAERDVLVFLVDGSAILEVDGDARMLCAGEARIVAKGSRRQLVAGPRGVRYLSVHLRRPPLQISPLSPRS
jgi:hemerythrin-like domain-containing protein